MDRFFTEGRQWDERHGNEVRRLYEEGRRDEEVNASEVNLYEVNASEVNTSEVNEHIQTGEGDQRSDSDSIVRSEVNASEETENRENAESAVVDAIVENVSQASDRNIETGDSEEQSDTQGNGGNDIAHGALGGNAQSGGGGSSFESERRFDCRFCPSSFLMYQSYLTHVQMAHPNWEDQIQSGISPSAVAVIGDSESDTTVAVLDDNDENERTLVRIKKGNL